MREEPREIGDRPGGPAVERCVHQVLPVDRYQALGEAGLAMINAEVTRQASMVAYIDDFYMMFWLTIISVPLMLLIKPEKKA